MIDELYGDLRNAAVEGIVLAIDDSGAVQRVDVQTHDGVIRSGIEVYQIPGLSSYPVKNGKALLIALGGDVGNMRALVSDSTRYGNQAEGERTLYCPDGTRVSVRPGGLVEIWGGTSITTHSPTAVINAPNGCTINGPVQINGDLTVSGDISDHNGAHQSMGALRNAYDAHEHPVRNVQPGSAIISTDLTDHPVT